MKTLILATTLLLSTTPALACSWFGESTYKANVKCATDDYNAMQFTATEAAKGNPHCIATHKRTVALLKQHFKNVQKIGEVSIKVRGSDGFSDQWHRITAVQLTSGKTYYLSPNYRRLGSAVLEREEVARWGKIRRAVWY